MNFFKPSEDCAPVICICECDASEASVDVLHLVLVSEVAFAKAINFLLQNNDKKKKMLSKEKSLVRRKTYGDICL